jgi:hypothetical protein
MIVNGVEDRDDELWSNSCVAVLLSGILEFVGVKVEW